MSAQATTGGTALGAALGLGAAPAQVGGQVFVAEAARSLAFTGATHTLWMVAIATVLIVMGLLLLGLARRHEGLDLAGILPGPAALGT